MPALYRNSVPALFAILVLFTGCREKAKSGPPAPSRDFQAGEYYDYYSVKDSAFYYYNRVVANSADSLEKGTAYFKMGLSLLDAGDFYSAQENLLASIRTLDDKDSAHFPTLAADYNTLANATLELKDYEGAIRNYRLAKGFAPPGDPQLYLFNNMGVAYQKQGAYRQAIPLFDSALAVPTGDTSLLAKLISNRARTLRLADSTYPALPELRRALALRERIGDSNGINASYKHLSDYYAGTHRDSAFYYAGRRLGIARTIADPTDRLEALGQLARTSGPAQTKDYLEDYIRLNDSIATARGRARNQYGLIRFDAEKAKSDNLVLQRRVGAQRLVIGGVALLAALTIAALVVASRVRRRRLQLKAEAAIRESQLRTSQKVHDVVANGLYRIMNELEHRETIDKGPLLDAIEGLYERSRDISYEGEGAAHRDLPHYVAELADAFAGEGTKVILVGNDAAFWNGVSGEAGEELRLVLEELLVNMRKHSGAKNVVLRFEKEGAMGTIRYKDDGMGFGPGFRPGNGLRNTVNRIKRIGGEIIFGRNDNKGVSIQISFPSPSSHD